MLVRLKRTKAGTFITGVTGFEVFTVCFFLNYFVVNCFLYFSSPFFLFVLFFPWSTATK